MLFLVLIFLLQLEEREAESEGEGGGKREREREGETLGTYRVMSLWFRKSDTLPLKTSPEQSDKEFGGFIRNATV